MPEMKKVIAVDFDGTLFEEKWPAIGAPIWPIIKRALAEKAAGAELILWTTREGKPLRDALNACKSVGLKFDAINSNSDTMKAAWGNDPRKIGATEYWDDRAVNPFSLPVHCKDCRFYTPQRQSITWNNRTLYCMRCASLKMKPDDFCSCGERKETT